MINHTFGSTLLSLLSVTTLIGCALGPKLIGDLGDETAESETDGNGDGAGDGAGDGDGDVDGPFDDCVGPFSSPDVDPECDGLGVSCDNAGDHYNPDQADQDQDSFADIDDLCPLVPNDITSADSDKDGIGNDCDSCPEPLDQYNLDQ